jgi:hypothetical protein
MLAALHSPCLDPVANNLVDISIALQHCSQVSKKLTVPSSHLTPPKVTPQMPGLGPTKSKPHGFQNLPP